MNKGKKVETFKAPDDLLYGVYEDLDLIIMAKNEASKLFDLVENHQIAKNIHFFINNPFPLHITAIGRECLIINMNDPQIENISLLIRNVFLHFMIDNIEDKLTRTNVIVRKYKPGMMIPFHIDDQKYEEEVIGIILTNDRPDKKGLQFMHQNKVYTLLEDMGSVFCMRGNARYTWHHGLPPTSHERISITCRIFKEKEFKNRDTFEHIAVEKEEHIQNINASLILNVNRSQNKIIVINPIFNMREMSIIVKKNFNKVKAKMEEYE